MKIDLTKTEFIVCALTSAGYEAKEIAKKIYRSVFTIRTHLQKIREKNGFRNVSEMSMHFILENGDPRKYIATMLLVVQFGIIYNDISDDLKLRDSAKVSKKMKSKQRGKTKKLYV